MINLRHTVRCVTLAVAALLGSVAFTAEGVTQKEMEQARTITAFWYLRYANNGSGYLEEAKMPSTMADLEKILRTDTERSNLKTFKGISIPSDYASWDKGKLVEYWGETFFKSPGLNAQGKVAKSRVKSKLGAMTVAAPAATEATASPAPAADVAKDTPKETAAAAQPASSGKPIEDIPGAEEIAQEAAVAESAAVAAMADTAVAEEAVPAARKNGSGSTWIYIVALVVLVGVVVWLVIFASRTMQESNSGRKREDEPEKDEPRVVPSSSSADVSSLHREIAGLREECLRLGEENGRLESDLVQARREIEALKGRLRAATAVTSAATAAGSTAVASSSAPSAPVQTSMSRPAASSAPQDMRREIFLGRVNPKGLFVRADRQPVADKTVFVLTTSDGYTGSFRVLQQPDVIGRCLDNPDYYLAGGCTAADILATEDASMIRTLQAGTATFQDGCWHMVRKSKIAYE